MPTARFGPYVLYAPIASGSQGATALARPAEGAPRAVVIKRLHEDLQRDQELLRRFRHEARAAIAVDSPHVVRVLDAGRVGDTPYVAMAYVPGRPLRELLQASRARRTPLPVPAAMALVRDILAGVQAMHSAVDPDTGRLLGIVHRDLSPKNVLVTRTGEAVIIDLGLGRSNAQDWRTATGMIMGTPAYMPPEQAVGERVDERGDLYTVGVLLFELLTLERYLPKVDDQQLLTWLAAPTFRPPSVHRPDLDPRFDALLARALAFEPGARFQSAAEMAQALAPFPVMPGPELSALVEELVGEELANAQARVEAMLRAPLEHEPARARTETFARRLESAEAPTLLTARSELSTTLVREDPTPILIREPAAASPPARRQPAPGHRARVALLGAAAAVAATALLIVARTAGRHPETPQRPPAPPPALEAPPPPPVPEIRARDERPDPPAEQPAPPPSPAASAPARPRREPRLLAERPSPPPIEPEEVRVKRALEQISARCATLRGRAPNKVAQSDRLLLEASQWAGTTDTQRALEALRQLEARLSALESAP